MNLEEIKKRWDDEKRDSAVGDDIDWLIAEVERLREEKRQLEWKVCLQKEGIEMVDREIHRAEKAEAELAQLHKYCEVLKDQRAEIYEEGVAEGIRQAEVELGMRNETIALADGHISRLKAEVERWKFDADTTREAHICTGKERDRLHAENQRLQERVQRCRDYAMRIEEAEITAADILEVLGYSRDGMTDLEDQTKEALCFECHGTGWIDGPNGPVRCHCQTREDEG